MIHVQPWRNEDDGRLLLQLHVNNEGRLYHQAVLDD